MGYSSVARATVIGIAFLVIIFILFFYIIPIYNIRNRGEVIDVITTSIANRDERELNELLLGKSDRKTVNADNVTKFVQYISTNKGNKVTSEFCSSDDIIISVLNDNSEAMLVLSQKGLFSKWTLVNIRFL